MGTTVPLLGQNSYLLLPCIASPESEVEVFTDPKIRAPTEDLEMYDLEPKTDMSII